MAKQTKTQKQNAAVAKSAKAKKVAKVTMTKGAAVNVAMQAVEAHKKTTMSGLDAAAKVLAEAGVALDCKTIVERALAKGLWATKGATPAATLYSALIREIANRKDASRFKKTGPGEFTLVK